MYLEWVCRTYPKLYVAISVTIGPIIVYILSFLSPFFHLFCCNHSLGLVTKVRACKVASQEWSSGVAFHAPGRVWELNLHIPKWTPNFGSWSPNGPLNFQGTIAEVKTHWIDKFFISLESSWTVDVWNGLAWPIWTSETQVMAKRRAGGQVGNVTLDH